MNIVLVPGFTASTDTLRCLRARLEAEGHACHDPGFTWNTLINGELKHLTETIDSIPGPVTLIGHSAGGLLAMLAAGRRLDVIGVIGLGSPLLGRVDLDVPYYEARSLLGWLLPISGAEEVRTFPVGHALLPFTPCVQNWVVAKLEEINAKA